MDPQLQARLQSAVDNMDTDEENHVVVDDDDHDADEGTEELETLVDDDDDESTPPVLKKLPPRSRNLFANQDSHPYVLDMLLLQHYGPEWLEWETEVLEAVVEQRFGTLAPINLEKLQAIRTLHLVDSFWQSWEIFSPIAMALSGAAPDFRVVQVPTLAQAAVAVDIARRVRDDAPWSEEMKSYFECLHQFYGTFHPVDGLDFVQIDGEDYGIDTAKVAAAWAESQKSSGPPTDEGLIPEQLRRLWDVKEVLDDNRRHMRSQLLEVSRAG